MWTHIFLLVLKHSWHFHIFIGFLKSTIMLWDKNNWHSLYTKKKKSYILVSKEKKILELWLKYPVKKKKKDGDHSKILSVN